MQGHRRWSWVVLPVCVMALACLSGGERSAQGACNPVCKRPLLSLPKFKCGLTQLAGGEWKSYKCCPVGWYRSEYYRRGCDESETSPTPCSNDVTHTFTITNYFSAAGCADCSGECVITETFQQQYTDNYGCSSELAVDVNWAECVDC